MYYDVVMENKFKDNLIDLMKEKGINQHQLSKLVDISQATISRYCSGKLLPTMYCIIELANFFDVSTDYLLGIRD